MKKRRPGTRGGRRESIGETDPFERVTLPRPKPKGGRLPSDIADAAEAALDDMLQRTDDIDEDDILDEEPKTQTRSPSHEEISTDDDDDDDQILTVSSKGTGSITSSLGPPNRPSKMPLPAPPRTTSVQTVPRSTPHPRVTPAPRGSPPPGAALPTFASLPTGATPTRAVPSAPPSSVPSRPTPTGPPAPRPAPFSSPIPAPTRLRSSPTAGETPMARADYTTSERERSLEGATDVPTRSMIDETSPVPEDLIMDLQSAPVELPIDFDHEPAAETDSAIVRPELASLQVAVFEESAHLGSLQSTIVAAGHIVGVGATGRDGVARVLDALRDEDEDVHVVIAALPGREAIVEAALALEPRPVVIASFGCGVLDAVTRAHAVGADLAITRPHDVERIAPIMFAATRLYLEQRAARASRGSSSDEIGDEPRSLLAVDVFQRVLEREIKRAKKFDYALSVALFAVEIEPPAPPPGIRGILRARAGNALIHAIRDIDMATQLDEERFLVVFPYTDLKSAASLGRRVIAAVAAGDPVISGGRKFPPRVVGAIAGAMPGQPLSYAKLIKDATRTLDQARRDGAELAVQP